MANVEDCGWTKGFKINTLFSEIFVLHLPSCVNLVIAATFFPMTINIHTNSLLFFFSSLPTQLWSTHAF